MPRHRSWSPSNADGRGPLPGPGFDLSSFWDAVRRCSQRALHSGALRPISTHVSYVRDTGVEFVVRVSDNLLRKPGAALSYDLTHGENPFLPPDPELTIGDVPPHHVAVLNKFNVLENHVLVVTRGFVHQECPLTAGDFAAVAAGLVGGRGLAFYNAGRIAGASQPHRHFQLVPLPLGRGADVPTAVLFEGARSGVDTVGGLDFRHAFFLLDGGPDNPDSFARRCYECYLEALRQLGVVDGVDDSGTARLPPYNLLVTDRWLFLALRHTERCFGISVNGLGYAGSLFVSTSQKLERVRSEGPMHLLRDVSIHASSR